MVDTVLAPARRAAFELRELHDKALVLKQIDGTAVDERQQVLINLRLRVLGRFIVDVALLELLPRPFATVAISENLGAPVRPEQSGIFLDNSFGRKGRLALPYNVGI
jgi:hypothetical protein